MDKFVVLLFRVVEEEKNVSKIFCSTHSSAEYYISVFSRESEIKIIALISKEQGVVDLKKGESLCPFLKWLNKNIPKWRTGEIK